MARVVHTEPYAFLPQTLERGAVVASAPLLASLTRADKPFAQHAAYRDLCDVAETGGGGRRRLLLGDDGSGAFYTLVPIRPRRRGERRSLRTLPGVSLRSIPIQFIKYFNLHLPGFRINHPPAPARTRFLRRRA